jgi:hypothetical protein
MEIAILIIVGVGALVGGIIWLVRHFEKKRTEALNAIASKFGLEFSAAKDDQLLQKMQVFALFNKGHSRKIKNVMKAETEIASLTVFDYQYTTGGGQSSQVHSHTVVTMESDSLSLPIFKLRPENFFDKVGAAMGFQDINFDTHPEFSKSFVLQGENEDAIRNFFDTEMLEFLAKQQGCYIESAPGVFIYLRGGRKKPEQIRELIDEGYAVYGALTQRMSRAHLREE